MHVHKNIRNKLMINGDIMCVKERFFMYLHEFGVNLVSVSTYGGMLIYFFNCLVFLGLLIKINFFGHHQPLGVQSPPCCLIEQRDCFFSVNERKVESNKDLIFSHSSLCVPFPQSPLPLWLPL